MHLNLPDYARMLKTLNKHHAEVVVVGGFAVLVHGSTNTTEDLDLVIAPQPDAMQQLADALNELHPRIREGGPRVELDEHAFGGHFVRYYTEACPVDIVRHLPEGLDYHQLAERAVEIKLYDSTIKVASIPDLILMKHGSDREKDRLHVAMLTAVWESRLAAE